LSAATVEPLLKQFTVSANQLSRPLERQLRIAAENLLALATGQAVAKDPGGLAPPCEAPTM